MKVSPRAVEFLEHWFGALNEGVRALLPKGESYELFLEALYKIHVKHIGSMADNSRVFA